MFNAKYVSSHLYFFLYVRVTRLIPFIFLLWPLHSEKNTNEKKRISRLHMLIDSSSLRE